MQNKEPIWTKSFISLFLTNFSVFIVFYGLVTTLPLYAKDLLQRTDEEAGLLMTVFLLSAIVVRPFTGKVLDMFGKRKMLWIGLLLYLICTILYYVISPFEWLLLLRFLHGIWFSLVTTAAGSLAADAVPFTRRGAGLGYFVMSTNLAVVVGPFIALFIIQTFSFDMLFLTMSGLMTVGALLSLAIGNVENRNRQQKVSWRFTWSDLFEKKALPIAFIGCVTAISYASVLSYISIYAQEQGVLKFANLFFLVFAAVMILSRPFTGKLYDEKGPSAILIPGFFLFIIGLLLLAFMNGSIFFFLLAGAFVGLGYGSLIPSFQTIAVQSTTHERSGYATATFFTLFDTGLAMGSYILGLIAVTFNYQVVYICSAILIAVIFLFYVRYQKNKVQSVNETQ